VTVTPASARGAIAFSIQFFLQKGDIP
jgi:hypothetical protein